MNLQWKTCCTCSDGEAAIIGVDLSAVRELPGLGVPNLLRVQYVLREPDEDGLPGEEDERRIETVRAELSEWIRAAGGRFVGEVSAAGQHSWLFYMACGPQEAVELVHRIGLRLGVTLGAEMLPDARHEVFFEELMPTAEEWRVHENALRLCGLLEAGDDLSRPREVMHLAMFENRGQALAFMDWARRKGFATRILRWQGGDAAAETPLIDRPWLVEFSREMCPQPAAIDEETRAITQAAAHLGGEYRGWRAAIVRAPQTVA